MSSNEQTARSAKSNQWAICFQWSLWIGIIQDFVLGVPAVIWPVETLQRLGQPTPGDPVYVSFAAVTLLILGTMYIPAAISPYRNLWLSWFSVLARPPGIVFFLVLYPNVYPMFGYIDAILSSIQIPLLILALYARPLVPFKETGPDTLDPLAQNPFAYTGTSYESIRSAVWSDPYEALPYHLALGPLRPIRFFNASARNLIDKRDLLPYFDKQIHAMGIAFSGAWEITSSTDYSGYFAMGSKGLVIARASVAGLTVSPGTLRALGIAGKIFPTLDPNQHVYPANFVTVSHLSGSWARHVVDIPMTNSPSIGLDPFPNVVSRIIFRLLDTRPGLRQLHPISTLGLAPGAPIRTPDLMLLSINSAMPRVAAKDFREEMRVRNYPGGKLVYDIRVRDFSDEQWQTIGTLTFSDDVVSQTSDKRLHFWIPRDIPDQDRPSS